MFSYCFIYILVIYADKGLSNEMGKSDMLHPKQIKDLYIYVRQIFFKFSVVFLLYLDVIIFECWCDYDCC